MTSTSGRTRTQLAVPGSNPRMIEKALASDADAVFLDLEDAVAPDLKAASRATVAEALRRGDWRGRPSIYRINALDTPYFYRDLVDVLEVAGAATGRVIVPKVDRVEGVTAVAAILDGIERAMGFPLGAIGIEAQIETAEGLLNAEAIAFSSPRLRFLTFGPGDFAASIRMPSSGIGAFDEWDAEYSGHRFHYAMSRILIAARAAGIGALDGPYADYRDEAGLRASGRIARGLGYDGKWVIHPGQIATVNEIFSPSREEVAQARRIVDEYERATAEGTGAMSIDGRLVDAASIRMARATLDWAGEEGKNR